MIADIKKAVAALKKANNAIAFTGAGISVESGIPSFRGAEGIWNQYDPKYLEISYFFSDPINSWKVIKEIFYDSFKEAKPNAAHYFLAWLESKGILKALVTQNIDNLHQEAGSKNVLEFHGNTRQLICMDCGKIYDRKVVFEQELPLCNDCHGILKPDFVFFGEAIPEPAGSQSFKYALKADAVIIIGSTGEVMPACNVPYYAKQNGAVIIEINPEESNFTRQITDIFLKGKASEVSEMLREALSQDH